MAVDFSITGIIGTIAQVFCGGSMTMAGILVMLAVLFIMIMILANLKAPVTYALVPMIMLDIVFAMLGIVDSTVSFIIVVISAVLIAKQAQKVIGG